MTVYINVQRLFEEKTMQCSESFDMSDFHEERLRRRVVRANNAGRRANQCMSNSTHTLDGVHYCRRHAANRLLVLMENDIK